MNHPLRALNHVGLTIGNLERTLGFYRDVFGVEPVIRGHGTGPDIERSLAVPGASIQYAFLEFGNARIELLQYDVPEGKSNDRWVSDIGSPHVCFEVADVWAFYREMGPKGVDFVSAPITLDASQGQLQGLSYVYLRDPDGIALQLYQLPAKA
jgi:catechol 2,3-dioxygenase-like lactoylglutathione lyase family enzyme